MSCRVLVVGRGRMGRLIETLAPEHGVEIAGTISRETAGTLDDRPRWAGVDVVVDVTHASALLDNLPRLCALGANLVVGTTGWQAHGDRVRAAIDAAGIGAVVAANFSVGANLLDALAERAAALFEPHASYGAFIHEAHHAAKKDAPSGTALTLRAALERGGLSRPVDMSSTRAGFIPGTHTVGFDGPAETVALTHTVRDRATFAHGALVAARWVRGRRGWFTMRQVLGLE
jgi:4-hydroxy-tetrahydrodipicolinate reductase